MNLPESIKRFCREELENLVRIPSISFPNYHPEEVEKSASLTSQILMKAGFDHIEVLRMGQSHPYVLAEKMVDSNAPTALLYAHHDVQPPGREEAWNTPVFEPVEKEGRLYGRGTADDKAGVMVHAGALRSFTEKGDLPPINLKVIIDGEEEVGSPHLLSFLKEYFERLKSDVIIVTDTANVDSGIPSLTTSLRGLVAVEVVVRSLKAPLHSGFWGGAVEDPVQILCRALSSLSDREGNIQLKSIQKGPSNSKTKELISPSLLAEQAGATKGESVPRDALDRIWNQASLSVNAIQASSEQLASNIICDRVFARLGIRLSARESAEEVGKELVERLRLEMPSSVECDIQLRQSADAWHTNPQEAEKRWAFEAAEKALAQAYQRDVEYIGCGASIPFIGPFEEAMKAPVLTLGIEDPYTLAHGENESLLLSDFYNTTAGEILLFSELKKHFH